jgi:hypothetical protein
MDSVRRGVELGVEEASRTAALFGLVVELEAEPEGADEGTMRAAQRFAERRVSAMIVAVDDARCREVVALAAAHHVLLMTLECEADTAGVDACDRVVFHVRPTSAITHRARARPTGGKVLPTDTATLALWHHTLRRFGAEQLNERFHRRFGSDMESAAWAGWVATKIVTEAALRGRSTSSANLARYLLGSGVRFDGHKGEPLAFNRATGELRQPLYVIAPPTSAGTAARVAIELSEDAVFGSTVGSEHAGACERLGRTPTTP